MTRQELAIKIRATISLYNATMTKESKVMVERINSVINDELEAACNHSALTAKLNFGFVTHIVCDKCGKIFQ